MRTGRVGRLELDREKLVTELENNAGLLYADVYREYLCGGPWKSCVLWSVGGSCGDGVLAHYDYTQPPAPTANAAHVPYLASVIERSFDLRHLRFARLAVIADSLIIPHRDWLELSSLPQPLRLANRIHVPLLTNDSCYFSEEDVVYRMRFGEVWFLDATRVHSAASFSAQNRVHLLLDFAEVADPSTLFRFAVDCNAGIPQENRCERPPLSSAERTSLTALGSLMDADNLREIVGIVIRKHYRRDGGANFVWDTLLNLARSAPAEVRSEIVSLHQQFLLERTS